MKKKLFAVLALVIVAAITGVSFAATTGTGSITPTTGGVGEGGIASVAAASSGTPSWTPAANSAGSITAGDLYTISTVASTPANSYSGDLLVTLYLTDPDELVGAYSYLNQKINVKAACNTVSDEETVGTGDDNTKVFTLDHTPVCGGSETVSVVDREAQVRDTDYTINYKTGTITFTTAPENTKAVTATYNYYDSTQGSYATACLGNGNTVPDTWLSISSGYVSFIIAGCTNGAKYKVTVDDGAYYCVSTSNEDALSPEFYLTVTQAS